MAELKFRKLRADEIQVRPTDTKTKGKCLLLLYQDARCSMNILDETVGQFGWQKDYKEINGNIYCGIGIRCENEWIWKYDCGAITAKEDDIQGKADASDAMKRAAVCWSIGRELYSTPKIKITCPDSYYFNDKMNMTFSVKSINWDGDRLVDLVIVDRFGKEVYNYNSNNQSENNFNYKPEISPSQPSQSNKDILDIFFKKISENEPNNIELQKFYNYYLPKCETWKNKFNVEQLWVKWNTPKQ